MPTDKRRVALYLPGPLIDRAKALADRIPGASMSGLVADLLDSALQPIEALLEAAESGDAKAQQEMMARLLADSLLGIANDGTEVLRIIGKSGQEKEKVGS